MIFFDTILINIIYILFPITLYILYRAYCINTNEPKKEMFLDIALLFSTYLLIKYSDGIRYSLIFLEIPLLISYLKNKPILAIGLSVINIITYCLLFNYNYYLLFLEYTLYFFLYTFFSRKKDKDLKFINTFTLIKTFILSLQIFLFMGSDKLFINNFLTILISVVIFYVSSNLIVYYIRKTSNIVKLNNITKELEKEKTLRNSLFKITHEIKNPIAVCKGYLDMMDLNNIEKTAKYLKIIRGEIARTIVLMDDYMEYNHIKLNLDMLDINMLLEDVIDSMESLFCSNKLQENISILDEEVYISGDYNRLKQVFVNVIKNSIEAKQTDRNLTLDISSKVENNNIVIKIKDNGVGIDIKQLERVGELFYTTKTKGNGFGVSLSKEIIKLHEGTITYDSVVNEYTIVTITLPIVKL
ncbi:MAG: HAMP domain-containing sensor histidine kinase [Clostridia bacterium]